MTSLQQTAMGGGDATPKTANYILVATDAGTTVAMNAAGATTITVNTGLFAAGDTVFIQNRGAGACTLTAGTATVATAGSLILPQNDAGILYFTSASAAIFYDYIQAGAVSPLTTKGDLYTFSTSDDRLGVGANGTTLVADSSEATGLKWQAAASAGGMTLISETVASGLTSLSFTSLGSHKQLLLVYTGIQHSATGSLYSIRFNSNTGSVYNFLGTVFNQSAGFTGGSGTSLNGSPFGENATGAGNNSCSGELLIDNYTSASKLKAVFYRFSYQNRVGDIGNFHTYNSFFDSTTAITSIDIFRVSGAQTFSNITNHTIRLYGIS